MKIGKKILKALEAAGFGVIDFTVPAKLRIDNDKAEAVIESVLEEILRKEAIKFESEDEYGT